MKRFFFLFVSAILSDGYFVVLYDNVEVQTVKIGNGTFKDCYFTKEPIERTYSMLSGKRSECSYRYHEMIYVGENGTIKPIGITFSVTDDGVAFNFNESDESISYVIPEGTKVEINGVVYTAEDIGGGVRGNHIDIFYESHEECLQFGVRYAEVYKVN